MIIVIGYGNPLRGDDGVGVKIVQKLEEMNLPKHIKIIDGGISGFDMLMDIKKFEKLIIIDSIISSGKEGALYRMTPPAFLKIEDAVLSTHGPSWISFLKSKIESGVKDCWSNVIFYCIEIKNTMIGTELSSKIAHKIPDYINSILKELQ